MVNRPENQGSQPRSGISWMPFKIIVGSATVLTIIFVALMVSGVLGGAGGGSSQQRSAPSIDRSGSTFEATERLACRDFRSIARDLEAGILTVFELREKLQDLHSRTSRSENRVIRTNGEAMLRAITQDDSETFGNAARRFESECSQHGH